VTRFIAHLYTPQETTDNHTLQITVPTKLFPVCCIFTSRFLSTASNSGNSSASHAHVLSLPALVQDCLPAISFGTLNRIICRNCQLQTPPILILATWDPHYVASGRLQQKTPFPSNSSIVIEVCLARRCIETVVFLLLCACSFPRQPVYRVVAQHWTSTLTLLVWLSGVVSPYCTLNCRYFYICFLHNSAEFMCSCAYVCVRVRACVRIEDRTLQQGEAPLLITSVCESYYSCYC
jgi:hypothetical protein